MKAMLVWVLCQYAAQHAKSISPRSHTPAIRRSIRTHLCGVGKPPLAALPQIRAKAAHFKAFVSHSRARSLSGVAAIARVASRLLSADTLPHRDRGGAWSRSNHYAYLWKVAAARFAVAGRPHPPRSPDRRIPSRPTVQTVQRGPTPKALKVRALSESCLTACAAMQSAGACVVVHCW